MVAISRRENIPPSQAADEMAQQSTKAIWEVQRIYVASPQSALYALCSFREFSNPGKGIGQ